MKKLNNNGFAHPQLLVLAVLVLGLVGYGGWRVYQNQHKDIVPTLTSSSPSLPSTISSRADLETTIKSLNNTSVSSSLNSKALDSDIKSLL